MKKRIFVIILSIIMSVSTVVKANDEDFNEKTTVGIEAEKEVPVIETQEINLVSETNKSTEKKENAELVVEPITSQIENIEISRYMDLTQITGLSREDFYTLMTNFQFDYDGFYARNACNIWYYCQKYQVNEIFICGVFAIESLYGSDERHIASHNYGSIMTNEGQLVNFANDAEGIEANIKLFANCYLNTEGKYYNGVTLDSISDTYCPPTPSSWADKVYSCMQMFLNLEN